MSAHPFSLRGRYPGGMLTDFPALIPFVCRFFHIRRTRRSYESPRYLAKWLLISTLTGLVAGFGAVAFYSYRGEFLLLKRFDHAHCR